MFAKAKVTDMGVDGVEHKLPKNTPYEEIHSTLLANGFKSRKGASPGMYHNAETGKKAMIQGQYVQVYEEKSYHSFLAETDEFLHRIRNKLINEKHKGIAE